MNVSFLFNILNERYKGVFIIREQTTTNVFVKKTEKGKGFLLKCRKSLIFSESVA